MMNRGKRKAHRKTARRASFLHHSIGTQDEDEEEVEESNKKEDTTSTSSEQVVSSKYDGETQNGNNRKQILDNSELIRSIRNIIQAELQPLKRDLGKLKKTVRSSVLPGMEGLQHVTGLQDESDESKNKKKRETNEKPLDTKMGVESGMMATTTTQ
eukprot:g7394.t1